MKNMFYYISIPCLVIGLGLLAPASALAKGFTAPTAEQVHDTLVAAKGVNAWLDTLKETSFKK